MKSTIRIAVLLLVMIGMTGCATSPKGKAVSVNVSSHGVISVGRSKTSLRNIGKQLKDSGASPSRLIEVRVAKGVSKKMVLRLRQTIIRSGFPKVVVVIERAPTSYVTKGGKQ